MPRSMKAAIHTGKSDRLDIVTVELDDPKAGEVLVLRHLEPAPAVEFGADALVISRAGGIEITATATALRRGFVGDTIALRARNSDESFDAVVTGRNRVEVTDRATH